MKLFGLDFFGGKEGSVPVRTVSVERAAELVFLKPEVQKALDDYENQLQYMEADTSDVIDRTTLVELKATAQHALAREGVVLEFVPGRYNATDDESFEALMELYKVYKNPEHTESVS